MCDSVDVHVSVDPCNCVDMCDSVDVRVSVDLCDNVDV